MQYILIYNIFYTYNIDACVNYILFSLIDLDTN